jgi:flagellar assembly factor FliW
MSRKTNGMVLLNQGDFAFELLLPNVAKKYVTIDYKAPIPVSEEQKAEEQVVLDEIAAFEAELEAELVQ